MTDDQRVRAAFGGVARLFPLPNLVLLPHGLQGLHVFEPRYRRMTADALADDRLIAPVLLSPGGTTAADDRPAIESVACLGRITSHEELPDGRYALRLRGVARVRVVEELPSDLPYRTCRCEVLSDILPADLTVLRGLRGKLAGGVQSRFGSSDTARRHLGELFDSDTPLGPLCDALTSILPLPVELKQQLLEETCVVTRAEILVCITDTSFDEAVRQFPPNFSGN